MLILFKWKTTLRPLYVKGNANTKAFRDLKMAIDCFIYEMLSDSIDVNIDELLTTVGSKKKKSLIYC